MAGPVTFRRVARRHLETMGRSGAQHGPAVVNHENSLCGCSQKGQKTAMRELIIQILLDNAPWSSPDNKHRDRPGMPAWMMSNGLLIRHPDGGLIFLPDIELLAMQRYDDSMMLDAVRPF